MTRYSIKTAKRLPPPAPQTADDTFRCTGDIVAELKRLYRPRMAAWVERQGHENAASWREKRQLMAEIHQLREQLGLNKREKPHDPRPPAEASD
jgi:hypothetical protein